MTLPTRSMLWTTMLCLSLLTDTGCREAKESDNSELATAKTLDDSSIVEKKPDEQPRAGTPEVDEIDEIDEIDAKPPVARRQVVSGAISAAINAIDTKDQTQAKAELAKALDGLAKLERDRPVVEIIVETWRANEALHADKTAKTVDTIALLSSVNRPDIPVDRSDEIEARHELRKGQSPGSISQADKSSDLAVIDSNLIYQEVDLPIASTKIHVQAAQQLLEEGKPAEARNLLTRALGSYGVIQIIAEAPAYQARQMVSAAQTAFVRDDLDSAKRVLTAATDMLTPISKSEADPQAQKLATVLIEEIAPIRDALNSGDTKQLDALARIERDLMSLVRRTAMRAMLEARHETERLDLANSLMWLERAENRGLLKAEDHARASEDLETAVSLLASASQAASPQAKPKFDDLHARAQHLVELNQLNHAQPRDMTQLESEFRRLRFDLRMLLLDLGLPPATKTLSQG